MAPGNLCAPARATLKGLVRFYAKGFLLIAVGGWLAFGLVELVYAVLGDVSRYLGWVWYAWLGLGTGIVIASFRGWRVPVALAAGLAVGAGWVLVSGVRAMVKGLGSVGWRSFFVQAAKNYRTMLGMGYAFSELPLHKKLPAEQRKPLLTESAEFFNTMPYFIPLTIGMTARARHNGMSEEQVRGMKSTVLGPFGALGDAFYWATLKPAAAVLGVLFALWVSPLAGIIVLLALFNLFHLPLRLCGAFLGYNLFTKVPAMLEKLKPYRIIAFLQLLIGISLGLTMLAMVNLASIKIMLGLAASLGTGLAAWHGRLIRPHAAVDDVAGIGGAGNRFLALLTRNGR